MKSIHYTKAKDSNKLPLNVYITNGNYFGLHTHGVTENGVYTPNFLCFKQIENKLKCLNFYSIGLRSLKSWLKKTDTK